MKYEIHSLAEVSTKKIGENTKVWQFVIILDGASIGKNCNICSHCFIENDVTIGDRVTIKNGVRVFDSVEIEDDVFVGPNSTFTNDPYPRSDRNPEKAQKDYPKTIVRKGASIGAGAVILPGVEIGEKAVIGAGSIVTKDVEPGSIVYGDASVERGKIKD